MTTEYLLVDSCKNPNVFVAKLETSQGIPGQVEDINGDPNSALVFSSATTQFLNNPWTLVSGQTWMVWSFWLKIRQGSNSAGAWLVGGVEAQTLTTTYSDALLGYSDDNGLYVYKGPNGDFELLGVVLDYDVWYHIEYAHRFGSASTGDWVVYVNGNEVGSGVGDSDGESWNYFFIEGMGVSTSTLYDNTVYDDVILALSDDPTPPRLSMLKVAHLLPTGTAQGQWTGSDGNSVDNHLLVDDDDAGSADYVESTAGDNEVDLYTHSGLPAGATPVVAQLAVAANLDALGTDDFSAVLDSNGSQATEAFVLGTGSPEWKIMSPVDSDPDGSVPWTKAKIDAATFGVSS